MDKKKVTREEEIEFSKLKFLKDQRGFFLPAEKERWEMLFDKMMMAVMPALEKQLFLDDINFSVLAN